MSTKVRGMMLLELIITVAIIGILVCFSQPLLNHAVSIEERTQELTSILTYARLQAFIREETLVLAPLENDDWSTGIKLLTNQGKTLPEKPKQMVHVWHWPASKLTVNWFGFQAKDFILVDSDSAKLAMNGYFLLKNNQGILRKIIVNRFGRV